VGKQIVRHEIWGGRRYVTVQVEGRDGRLAQPGAKATYRWAIK
jgi:hypothetical protein